jgi:hypothetical protein
MGGGGSILYGLKYGGMTIRSMFCILLSITLSSSNRGLAQFDFCAAIYSTLFLD